MNPPDNLPPLPPVPPGFDRWEYRGKGFTNDHKPCAFAYAGEGMDTWIDDDWAQYIDATPNGDECSNLHYLEAVREPAEEEPPFPGAKSDSIEGLANFDHFVSKAFTKSFTVGGSEPANELAAGEPSGVERELARNGVMLVDCNLSESTGVESIATREWCVKSAEIEGEAEIGAGTPTGVEARVCEDIAARQRLGIAKYGRTVEQSGDDMLQHAMCEAYDLSVYLRAEWERKQACEDALAPFRNVARGIPENWPGECILRFDQRADGSIFLSYHGVNDASNGITIDQWRKLLPPIIQDHE